MDQIAREVAAPQPTTAELRAQIARTRGELSGTIEGIQERLSPACMVSRAKNALTGGGASNAVLGVVRRIPRKPVPIALAAAAVAGVAMFARSRAKRRQARPVLAYSAQAVPVRGGTSKFVTAIGTGFAIWNALNRRAALR
jgi:hypothetical protein